MTRRRVLLLAMALLLVLGLGVVFALVRPGADSAAPAAAPPGPPALRVVASTNVYSAIAGAVGGDRVVSLPLVLDANTVASAYEPSPGDASEVASADVVIFNGGGYDDFMTTLLGPTGAKPARVNVSEVSGLIAPGVPFNEHSWYSLTAMRTLASRLAAEFSRLDPANAQRYVSNAQAFATRLGALLVRADDIEAEHAGTRVILTDPTPGYLIEECGLVDATPDRFAGAQDEPDAAAINETTALLQGSDPVRAVIVNPQAGGAAATALEQSAAQARVPVVRMTETMPFGASDYVSWMSGQLDQLTAALDRP